MELEIARLLMATSLRSVERMYQGFSMETGNMSLVHVCRYSSSGTENADGYYFMGQLHIVVVISKSL